VKTYQAEHARQLEELQQLNREAREAGELLNFYRRHRELIPCKANSQIILEYLNGDEPNQAVLEEALGHPQLHGRLARQTTQEDREKIETEILALMSGGTSPDGIEHEKANFKYKSTEELRNKLETLQARKALRQKTPAELRAIIRPATTPPTLPLEWTRESLLAASPDKLRHLIKLYGIEPINAVLAK
jgi:hypothetical protein